MAAIPLMEELGGNAIGPLIAEFAGFNVQGAKPENLKEFHGSNALCKLSVYDASAGYELADELEFLSSRTVEPNLFFHPRFLAPAMPRLEDRQIFFSVIRDEAHKNSRLRFLLPYSIERPSFGVGPSVMRAWANHFGPLGTPLIDRDNPIQTADEFFSIMARPNLKLPKVLVIPEINLEGNAASVLRTAALGRNLSIVTTSEYKRPILRSDLEGEDYLRQNMNPHHYRGYARLKRRLGEKGTLRHCVARNADEVRIACEHFLNLEVQGWKGRSRTAMASDRLQAAFVREAIHRLSEADMVRVHTLTLDDKTIAALVVFVERGTAYTWKTTYDETYSNYSPGTLLMLEVTNNHLDDPNIEVSDSCARADHPVMSRIWSQRQKMGTLVIGLTPSSDRAVRQTAAQLHLYRETRNMAKIVRDRMRSFIKKR